MSTTWLIHEDGESAMRFDAGPAEALAFLKANGWREVGEAEAREIMRRVDAGEFDDPEPERP